MQEAEESLKKGQVPYKEVSMHHELVSPAENAYTCIKWILIWLFAGGLPCVVAMYLPPWIETEEPKASH